jgi:signal transduction histidine kinase/CheY-like chemotaxis protein
MTRLLLFASVAIPAALFSFLAWQSHEDAQISAYRHVRQTTAILHEHALKVFEINATALDRTAEYLSTHETRRSDLATGFRGHLANVKDGSPSIMSLWAFASDGSAIATTDGGMPPPGPIVAGSDYFVHHRLTEDRNRFVSRPLIGPNKQAQFAITRRLERPDRTFAGVASSGIFADYFIEHWRRLAPDLDSSAGLVRDDGVILVRHPPLPVDAPALPADSEFMTTIRTRSEGVIQPRSPVDGQVRIAGFRKLSGYPVYIAYSVAMPAVLAGWYRTLALYGMLCGSAAFALVGMTLLVRRKIVLEQQALAQIQTESDARKGVQEELARANAELGRLLNELRATEESRTRFFTNVSHELRTPLALILGPVSQLLQQRSLEGQTRRQLSMVERSAHILQRHVSDLLDIARLEAGSMRMHYARVDLAELIRLAATQFQQLAADRGIAYDFSTPPSLQAEVDAEKIERMLLNLLSNSFNSTRDGGVIRLSARELGGRTLIEVEDNGPGVPEPLREAIFERFRQDAAGMARQHGTGLGLSIVREFAHLHDGSVAAADSLLGGALFRIDLPLLAPAGTEICEAPLPDARTIRRPADEHAVHPIHSRDLPVPANVMASHILIVEDNHDMSDFLAEALGRYYWVSRAFTRTEGVKKALGVDRPDLIVAHAQVTGMSGDLLVNQLRRDSSLEDVPIIMLTSSPDDALRVRLLRQGIQECIQQPFSVDELLARVENLLANRKRTGRLRQTEDHYRALFNSIDQGFCVIQVIFDEAGKAIDYLFLETNPSFEQQSGLCDVQGKTMRELAPDMEDHWFEVYGKVAQTGDSVRFQNHSKTLARWFDTFAFRYGDREDRHVGVLFNDITERIASEEALRDADTRKDHFLALLSHEMRNPLAPIRNGIQVLRLAGPNSQTAHEALLPMMERQLAHITRLLDDLLDVNRIKRGTIELRKESTDLALAVQTAVEANWPVINNLRHELVVSLPEPPLWLDADPVRLAQIVSNLLNNAATYTPAGGSIELKVEKLGSWILLRVRDNGIGMCEEDLVRVFRLFVRGGQPHVTQQGGLGIGLALVRSLAQMHGGTVEAHSAGLGCGSELIVRLPAASRNPVQSATHYAAMEVRT